MEEITSRQNEKVKHIANLCDSARYRKDSGLCVAHGLKLCKELLRFEWGIESLWLTAAAQEQHQNEVSALMQAAKQVYMMTDSVCEKMSPQRAPQGVVAVVKLPPVQQVRHIVRQRRIVALDSIQDPGNVGAVIRTAAALGYGGVLLNEACADPFSPKALRASMGASFGVLLAMCGDLAAALKELKPTGHIVIAADLSDTAVNIAQLEAHPHMTLVIGNEGNGLASDVTDVCDATVIIPITERVDSLNAAVAAGIAMWEMRP